MLEDKTMTKSITINPRKIWLILFVLILATTTFAQTQYPPNIQDLLDKAKQHDSHRYQFAFDKGAKIEVTADQKSFYLLWYPPNMKADKKTLIVTLHGSSGNVFNEFFLWYDEALKHGHGILALQWYFEGTPPPRDYYAPLDVYQQIAPILKSEKIGMGKAMLHGFSRGSANSYYVTLFDRKEKNNYFGLTLSNSGGASIGYPIYTEMEKGNFGEKPFVGTNWMTFCGGLDPNPDRDGCPAMRRTAEFVTKYGGKLRLAIEDENGDHGGFHRNKANVNKSLDLFDKILAENP